MSAYRIDLGIVHPDKPGVYLAGVECDGAMYHSSSVARERDRIRQHVLEGLGWSLLRVWSTDWWENRGRCCELLDQELNELLARSRKQDGAPEPAPEESDQQENDAGASDAGSNNGAAGADSESAAAATDLQENDASDSDASGNDGNASVDQDSAPARSQRQTAADGREKEFPERSQKDSFGSDARPGKQVHLSKKIHKLYREFWIYFCKYLHNANPASGPRTPPKQHYMDFPLGRSGTKLASLLISKYNKIAVRFQTDGKNNKAFYDQIRPHKEEIEAELGFSLDWQRLEGGKSTKVSYFRDADLTDRSQWDDYCEWMRGHIEKLDAVFRPRVKDLRIEDAMEQSSQDQ